MAGCILGEADNNIVESRCDSHGDGGEEGDDEGGEREAHVGGYVGL